MFELKFIDFKKNDVLIINNKTKNFIVYDFKRNIITMFNNTVITFENEYLFSHIIYKLYDEFESILKDIGV